MAGEPVKPGGEDGAPQDPPEPQDPGAAKADATLSAAGCIDCELARPALDALARRMISAIARSQRVCMRAPRACGDHRCRQCGLTPSGLCFPHMQGLSIVLLMKDATFRCLHVQTGASMAFEADEVAPAVFRTRFWLTLFDASD